MGKSSKIAQQRWHQENRISRLAKLKLQKAERRRIAKEFVREFLLAASCADCGEKDIVVLEFDHLRDKKYDISKLLSFGYKLAVIKDEIAKCDVVCANCHRRRTAVRGAFWKLF